MSHKLGGGTETPDRNDGNREIQVLDEQKDLIPATIEIHDKKITGLPKWANGSTGEEVLDWWIK